MAAGEWSFSLMKDFAGTNSALPGEVPTGWQMPASAFRSCYQMTFTLHSPWKLPAPSGESKTPVCTHTSTEDTAQREIYMAGVPGWLRKLSSHLLLSAQIMIISGSWDQVRHGGGLRAQLGICLRFSLCLCPPPSCSHTPALSLK